MVADLTVEDAREQKQLLSEAMMKLVEARNRHDEGDEVWRRYNMVLDGCAHIASMIAGMHGKTDLRDV
jgi:hypothetical protein